VIEKVKRVSDFDRLNELIDWYEKNKPEAGQEIQVALDSLGLAKMFKIKKDGKYVPMATVMHRGRKIVATGLRT
jgi:hypothetical protein